jgi:2-aminoadipate transaminase
MNETYDPLASVQAAGPPGSISFIYGLPDSNTFPVEELVLAFNSALRDKADLALQYGPEQGYGPLIDYLREKMRQDEGLELERPQIKLSGGASQALDHCCTLFSKFGDKIVVEAPTYHESLLLFRNHGLQPLQGPVDAEGMRTEELKSCLENLASKGEKPSFIYTIPTFQNPSGITLAEERRKEILRLAGEMDVLVVEDDVYRDLAYERLEVPSLFSLGGGRRVVRLGSFSKIIAPGLRLGWILGPEGFIDRFVQSGLRNMGGGANPLTAIAMAAYCQRGSLEPHIDSLKLVYKKRRDVMLQSLEANMPEGVEWTQPGGGFFIWLTLPAPLKAADVKKASEQEKILLLAGDPFFAKQPSGQHLRLAFSFVPPEKIQEGIEKLASILQSLLS